MMQGDEVVSAIRRDGFALSSVRLSPYDLRDLEILFADWLEGGPGTRIAPALVNEIDLGKELERIVRPLLGEQGRPVRALLFDKRDGLNWSLGWHQDRTIEVQERIAVEGFHLWTEKQGRLHVSPPIDVIERMITIRVHLDLVDADNAPLRVAPGSHRHGYVAEPDISALVARCGETFCEAEAGNIWIYATPILHASSRSKEGRRRRVLQFDYSADDLPGGLRWAADCVALEGKRALA